MTARIIIATALLAFGALAVRAQEMPSKSYTAFIEELWPDAKAKGVTRQTFDLAFNGLTADERVIKAIRRQPEYGKPFGDYVNSIANARRIAAGQRKIEQWKDTFAAVEKKFGVDRSIITAIWGIETDFGGGSEIGRAHV